jgi:hypothetical protein
VRISLAADGPADQAVVAGLRLTSPAEMLEILDGWFRGASSSFAGDVANVANLTDIEHDR